MTEGLLDRFGADIYTQLEAGPVEVVAAHRERGPIKLLLTLEVGGWLGCGRLPLVVDSGVLASSKLDSLNDVAPQSVHPQLPTRKTTGRA